MPTAFLQSGKTSVQDIKLNHLMVRLQSFIFYCNNKHLYLKNDNQDDKIVKI